MGGMMGGKSMGGLSGGLSGVPTELSGFPTKLSGVPTGISGIPSKPMGGQYLDLSKSINLLGGKSMSLLGGKSMDLMGGKSMGGMSGLSVFNTKLSGVPTGLSGFPSQIQARIPNPLPNGLSKFACPQY